MSTNTTTTKTTYTVTLPDGTTATRKTHRTYTHIVAWCDTTETQAALWQKRLDYQIECGHTDGDYANVCRAELAKITGDIWRVIHWCGRPDLAYKAADKNADYVVIPVEVKA